MVSALAFNVYTLSSHQSDYEHLSPFSLKYDKALVLRKFRIMICTFFYREEFGYFVVPCYDN